MKNETRTLNESETTSFPPSRRMLKTPTQLVHLAAMKERIQSLLLIVLILTGTNLAQATSPGSVVAWGLNNFGQTNVPIAAQSGVIDIAARFGYCLALKSNGTVVAWGENTYGQTALPVGLVNVVDIAAGDAHAVALKSNGQVVAWGGIGHNYGQTVVPVSAQSGVVAIAAGNAHTLAVKNDGTVLAWGNNNYGQINVPAGLNGVVAVAAGSEHSVALKSNGTVVSWGRNDYGQTIVPAGLSLES